VLDDRIGSGEEQTLVPVVVPTHDIRRRAVTPVDLEDLRVAVGFSDVVALDHDPVTD
jgi:hypothetical protein